MILLADSSLKEACIWTIVDAPAHEREAPRRVFQAELQALQRSEEPLVGSHLLNLQELKGRDLATLLPADHHVLFRRKRPA